MEAQLSETAATIEPEIARFVRETLTESAERAAAETVQPVPITRKREIAELVRARWTVGGPDMATTHNLTLPETSLRVRIHIPKNVTTKGTLLYLHGGGWMVFSIDTHDRIMREYAERTGCAVVGLDYSLAPENRFPQPLLDILCCIDWLREEGDAYGLDVSSLVIGGDSAGANLALASTLMLRDQKCSMPDGLLLNYVAVDTEARASHKLYDGLPYMLNADEMVDFWVGYLDAPTTDNPYARPLLADLSRLPPAQLHIAECDVLLDENLELDRRLKEAGNEVDTHLWHGATHSFLEAVSISETANAAFDASADWLKGVMSA